VLVDAHARHERGQHRRHHVRIGVRRELPGRDPPPCEFGEQSSHVSVEVTGAGGQLGGDSEFDLTPVSP
jgi:hypothetical protein